MIHCTLRVRYETKVKHLAERVLYLPVCRTILSRKLYLQWTVFGTERIWCTSDSKISLNPWQNTLKALVCPSQCIADIGIKIKVWRRKNEKKNPRHIYTTVLLLVKAKKQMDSAEQQTRAKKKQMVLNLVRHLCTKSHSMYCNHSKTLPLFRRPFWLQPHQFERLVSLEQFDPCPVIWGSPGFDWSGR